MTQQAPPGFVPIQRTTLEDRTQGAVHKTQEQQIAESYQRGLQQAQAEAAKGQEGSSVEAFERRADTGNFQAGAPGAVSAFEQKYPGSGYGNSPGAAETGITQFGRGVADAILAPGALFGMASEGLGEFTGNKWLRDFGRDLGEASSGKSYLEAAAFAIHGGFGEDKDRATTLADRTRLRIEQQEREWPLLSTVSRVAGQATMAIAAGAASAGVPAAGTMAGVAAYEGAGGGAQAAYEDHAPLMDVFAGSMLGAAIGGAAGYAGGRIAEHFRGKGPKMADLADALGSEVKRGARNVYATVDEVGGAQAKRVLDEVMGAKEAIARRIREAGPQQAAREAAEAAARSEFSQKLVEKASGDVSKWASKEPGALEKFVHRSSYLDQISQDLSNDFRAASQLRPALDFDLDANTVRKLVKDVDAPVAINELQESIQSLVQRAPSTDEALEFAAQARDAMVKISRAGLPGKGTRSRVTRKAYEMATAETMQEGHSLVKATEPLVRSQDELTREYGSTVRAHLVEKLSGDSFGSAGKAYKRAFVAPQDDALEFLADPQQLRESLRTLNLQGELLQQVEQRNQVWADAFEAQKQLSGKNVPKDTAQALKSLGSRVGAAERALTLDGKSSGRVLDYLGGKLGRAGSYVASEMGADTIAPTIGDKLIGVLAGHALLGGIPGMALGFMVSNYVAPYINRAIRPIAETVGRHVVRRAAPALGEALGGFVGTAHLSTGQGAYNRVVKPIADRKPASALPIKERQERHRERMETLAEYSPDRSAKLATEALTYFHELGPNATGELASAMNNRVDQLMKDMPTPRPHIGGPAYEVLSHQDLRRSEAMWDATFDPMGMFEEFEKGIVNYDRIEYTWKQYPGLQQAVQAGITDTLMSQLSDEARVAIPSPVMSQLDFLGGFGGQLHASNNRGFSMTITQSFEQMRKKEGSKQRPQPPAKSPIAEHKKSWTERIMR